MSGNRAVFRGEHGFYLVPITPNKRFLVEAVLTPGDRPY
jgi:hypothetical protein